MLEKLCDTVFENDPVYKHLIVTVFQKDPVYKTFMWHLFRYDWAKIRNSQTTGVDERSVVYTQISFYSVL